MQILKFKVYGNHNHKVYSLILKNLLKYLLAINKRQITKVFLEANMAIL